MARAALWVLVLVTGCTAAGLPASGLATPTPDPTARETRRPTAQPTAQSTPRSTVAPTPAFGREPTGPTQAAVVSRVIDGDTIEVEISGRLYTVRYIGIDTPETVHPSEPVQWLGPEASAANAELVAGKQVVLETDVSETDQFGRLLRYVWLQESGAWLLVNLELLRRGLATVTTYPPDVKYVDALYVPAQDEAQAAGVGLWGTPPTPVPTATPAATAAPPAANCDPSYPDVCIAPYPPDLDCGEIPYRRFRVLQPDPHGFDRDRDGIGCES